VVSSRSATAGKRFRNKGSAELLADRKKAQVVNGHAEYGAENEKVEAALHLIEPAICVSDPRVIRSTGRRR